MFHCYTLRNIGAEEVIPAGEPTAMREFFAPDFFDHEPDPRLLRLLTYALQL
jgi:hypothetical protein